MAIFGLYHYYSQRDTNEKLQDMIVNNKLMWNFVEKPEGRL